MVLTLDSKTDTRNFEFQRQLAFSRTFVRGVTLISTLWIGLGFYLGVPVSTAAAACVTVGAVSGVVLHAWGHHTLARCIWLGASNFGVFIGSNLVDPVGHMDFLLVACVGVPFLIFSWRRERGLMLTFVSVPIVLWGVAWEADFNLFGFHEVGQEIAGQYIDLASALTVFVLVAMELGLSYSPEFGQ